MKSLVALQPLQTMNRAFQEICEGQTPWVPLGNFTNDFFDFVELRADLLTDPIECPTDLTPDQQKWAFFCAASVDFLCETYHLPRPAWIDDPAYAVLPEPWFHSPAALHSSRVRERYERQTPTAFAKRNIYCGNRVFLDKRKEAELLKLKLTA